MEKEFEVYEFCRTSFFDNFLDKLIKFKSKEISENEFKSFILNNSICEAENYINVQIGIFSGVGGTEAYLFAKELFNLYIKFFDKYKFNYQIFTSNNSFIIKVSGKHIYKLFRLENGIHRVQRIPSTENKGRIQTSAIGVYVLPIFSTVQFNLDPKDLRIDRFRAGGPGGQFVNKTESAVRVVHLPTKLSVVCQDYRNQLQNKQKALDILQQKIIKLKEMEANMKTSNDISSILKNTDRSEKKRTYNWPRNSIVEHLTNKKVKLDSFFKDIKIFKNFLEENLFSYEKLFFMEGCPEF